MRALIVCTLLLLWAVPALAEQKSAPDGFGPIKFGMTKDEVREATGVQEQPNDDGSTISKAGLPDYLRENYTVEVRLVDGKVGDIIVSRANSREIQTVCINEILYVLARVGEKYGQQPIHLKTQKIGLNTVEENYLLFTFGGGVAIHMDAWVGIDSDFPELKDYCHVQVWYTNHGTASGNPF